MSLSVPFPFSGDDLLADAYARGLSHGRNLAAYNVPKIGKEFSSEGLGTFTIDAENIREAHASACYEAESNSRQYSPFEFTAHEFNTSEHSEGLWEAFDAGTQAQVAHDLAQFTDADYGLDDEADETE